MLTIQEIQAVEEAARAAKIRANIKAAGEFGRYGTTLLQPVMAGLGWGNVQVKPRRPYMSEGDKNPTCLYELTANYGFLWFVTRQPRTIATFRLTKVDGSLKISAGLGESDGEKDAKKRLLLLTNMPFDDERIQSIIKDGLIYLESRGGFPVASILKKKEQRAALNRKKPADPKGPS